MLAAMVTPHQDSYTVLFSFPISLPLYNYEVCNPLTQNINYALDIFGSVSLIFFFCARILLYQYYSDFYLAKRVLTATIILLK